jgi:hypothetical protein
MNIFNEIDQRFVSGNDIPVPSIMLTREMWEKLKSHHHNMVDGLFQHCPNGECMECSVVVCPHKEPLHFHHDGCPACE